jgi:hypothetical protein
MTTHDAASKSRNRVTRIANGQVSIIRDSIEWQNDYRHLVAESNVSKSQGTRPATWVHDFVLTLLSCG